MLIERYSNQVYTLF